MSPFVASFPRLELSFPRVSGDEPFLKYGCGSPITVFPA